MKVRTVEKGDIQEHGPESSSAELLKGTLLHFIASNGQIKGRTVHEISLDGLRICN